MDTSETYIKMCEKAVEIQAEMNINRIGDFFFSISFAEGKAFSNSYDSDMGITTAEFVKIKTVGEQDKIVIWLPRQDQLQEMVGGLSDYLLYRFWDFLTDKKGEYALNSYSRQFKSFEQLWLAFVMMKKFNKNWSPEKEDWVNVS